MFDIQNLPLQADQARAARNYFGLSQAKAAEACGLPLHKIKRFEAGNYIPDSEFLEDLRGYYEERGFHFDDTPTPGAKAKGNGSVFPSGHAAVLGCIWLFRERSGIDRRQRGRRGETVVIAGVVLLVSLGMIYSACHFATDVIAGLCLGIAVGDIVALAVQLNRGGRCAAPE